MPLHSVVSSVSHPIKDFFFPPLCFSCGARLSDNESRVCASCWEKIERVTEDDHTVGVLRERFFREGSVDEFFSCFYFEEGEVFQKLVHSLKYEATTMIGVELGRHVGPILKRSPLGDSIDAIIPIPLHRLKQRERGYNQAESICRGISEILGRPVWTHLVKRSKYTVSQTHLNADERKQNVGDAFEIPNDSKTSLEGKTLVVVDDVITTGSTIQAVARALKTAGAAKVIAASAGLAKLGLQK